MNDLTDAERIALLERCLKTMGNEVEVLRLDAVRQSNEIRRLKEEIHQSQGRRLTTVEREALRLR